MQPPELRGRPARSRRRASITRRRPRLLAAAGLAGIVLVVTGWAVLGPGQPTSELPESSAFAITSPVPMTLATTSAGATAAPAAPTLASAVSPGIRYSTDPTAVILRLKELSGGWPPRLALESHLGLPSFSVYGDGLVVYRGATNELRAARMSPDQVQAFLAFVLRPGGLDDPIPRSTVFRRFSPGGIDIELHAAGIDRRVRYMCPHDQAARVNAGGIWELHRRLLNFWLEVRNGGGTDLGLYRAPVYRLVIQPSDFFQTPSAWPWTDTWPNTPNIFIRDEIDRTFSLAVPGEVLSALPATARQGALMGVHDGKGQTYALGVRPLLPEEFLALDPTWSVRDPEAEALQRLGGGCFLRKELIKVFPTSRTLDRMINRAGGMDRWISQGKMWGGRIQAVAQAIGGEFIGQRGRESWVVVTGQRPEARKFYELRSARGRRVWINTASLRPCGGDS